jgi:DUF2075 family protein
MPCNFANDSYLWFIKYDSVGEIGCIHTCQGLELDYVGVIISEDMVYQEGKVLVNPAKRSKMDSSIKGYKNMLKSNPEKAMELTRAIIKNTYRTLKGATFGSPMRSLLLILKGVYKVSMI